MKRKEYQDKYDDFSPFYLSSPSAKSRRLDPESLGDRIQGPVSLEEEDQPRLASVNDERALVLYNPTNTPLLKSPTVTDFSVVVNSDFISGLKDQLLSMVKPTPKEQTNYAPDNSMAIVPWVASRAGPAPSPPEPEEVEMMDVEIDNSAVTEPDGASQNWHHQQQHCSRPELFHGNYTPITW